MIGSTKLDRHNRIDSIGLTRSNSHTHLVEPPWHVEQREEPV
jgi:hypothetical protein